MVPTVNTVPQAVISSVVNVILVQSPVIYVVAIALSLVLIPKASFTHTTIYDPLFEDLYRSYNCQLW